LWMNDAERSKSSNGNAADGKRQSGSVKSCTDSCRLSERREKRLRRSRRSRRAERAPAGYGRVSGGRTEVVVAQSDGEITAMSPPREQLVEEIRIAERARDLLAGLERRLKERDRSDLEEHLGRLERLAGSLPEAHSVRLLVEEAAAYARTRGAGKAGSMASRSRSKTEGRILMLRGILERQDAFANREA
jgi:hypothetical protein